MVVVEAFVKAKAAKPTTTCQLMAEAFPLDRAIIGMGTTADIATFRVSEKVIGRLGKQACTAWPPIMPQVGKGIICAGYPGLERIQTGVQEHNFGIYCAGSLAHSVALVTQQELRPLLCAERKYLIRWGMAFRRMYMNLAG